MRYQRLLTHTALVCLMAMISDVANSQTANGPILCYAADCRIQALLDLSGKDLEIGWDDTNGDLIFSAGETLFPISDLSPYSVVMLVHENTNGEFYDDILNDPAQIDELSRFLSEGGTIFDMGNAFQINTVITNNRFDNMGVALGHGIRIAADPTIADCCGAFLTDDVAALNSAGAPVSGTRASALLDNVPGPLSYLFSSAVQLTGNAVGLARHDDADADLGATFLAAEEVGAGLFVYFGIRSIDVGIAENCVVLANIVNGSNGPTFCPGIDTDNDGIDDLNDFCPLDSDPAHQTPEACAATPVGHWPLDGDGAAAVGENGTLVNAPIPTEDRFGTASGALSFDGALQQYVGIAGGGGLDGASQGTISMWVKWNGVQVGAGHVLARQRDGLWSDNLIFLSDPNPAIASISWNAGNTATSRGTTTSSSSPGAVWHHVAIVFSDLEHGIYFDGVLEDCQTADVNFVSLDSDPAIALTIGGWIDGGNSYSTSSIDDVKIFDNVLGSDAIQNLAEVGSGGPTGSCGLPATDTDGDTVPDDIDNCPLDANTDQLDTDMDGDGDVCDADDDNDNLTDDDELNIHNTDPLDADSDDDGLDDGEEVALGTNPNAADTDGDGLSDGDEVALGADPLDPDSAAPYVIVNYQATCQDNALGQAFRQCSGVGLTDGDPISATFLLNLDALPISLSLSAVDVVSWSSDFGTASLSSNNTDNWDFVATFNAAGNVVDFQLLASSVPSPEFGAANDLTVGFAFAGEQARCFDFAANAPAACQVGQAFESTNPTQGAGPVDSITTTLVPLDSDGDSVPNNSDNCPDATNTDQADLDGDGLGDVCDDDTDGDGLSDTDEVTTTLTDPNNADTDGDGINDGEEVAAGSDPLDPTNGDADSDTIPDSIDNCPNAVNVGQSDIDSDGLGDVCDDDDDGDGVPDASDNCPVDANADQADTDDDGIGDVCDLDVCTRRTTRW